MGLFLFLSVIQGIVAAALVALVLMQRSEGGGLGLGGGGSPGGLMSARGAADFLTRATKWLAVLFVALAILLAAMAVDFSSGSTIDDTLDRSVTTQGAPQEGLLPPGADPVPGVVGQDGAAPADPSAAPDGEQPSDDPLADVAG